MQSVKSNMVDFVFIYKNCSVMQLYYTHLMCIIRERSYT